MLGILKFFTTLLNAIPVVGGVLESLLDKIIDSALTKERENRKTIFAGLELYFNTMMNVGRFRHVSIDPTILSPVMSLNSQQVEGSLQDLLLDKWEPGRHFMLIGDGGAGKTISQLNLCKLLNDSFNLDDCIPIYISLSDYNYYTVNYDTPFLASRILKMSGKSIEIRTLFQCLNRHLKNKKDKRNRPSAVLMLDGFNEITVDDKSALIHEIKSIVNDYPNICLILSSRYSIKNGNEWLEIFEKYSLSQLSSTGIEGYLSNNNIPIPNDDSLMNLLGNPMMLTLYCKVSSMPKSKTHSAVNSLLKKTINTCGELLNNYLVSLVVKEKNDDPNLQISNRNSFLILYLLPYIGYRMERDGCFYFTYEQMCDVIADGLNEFTDRKYRGMLAAHCGFNFINNLTSKAKKPDAFVNSAIGILVNEIMMLVEEDAADGYCCYSFLHQNYRDFFAASFIVISIKACIPFDELSECLFDRLLPIHLIRFISEIEGEYSFRRRIGDLNYSYNRDESVFSRYLETCRGKKSLDLGCTVQNIIEIWKYSRGELTGIDFSSLNLKGCIFNNVICGRRRSDGSYLSADFSNSIIDMNSFMPQGHFQWVYSVVYCNEEKGCVSASRDKYIKEWLLKTSKCIYSFKCDVEPVYAQLIDDDRILGVLSDDTIIIISKNDNTISKRYSCAACVTAVAHNDAAVFVSLSNGDVIEYNNVSDSFTIVGSIPDVIKSIAVCPDNRTLLLGSSSGNVFVLDILHGTTKKIKIGDKAIKCIACGKNANTFAFTDGGSEIWEYSYGKKIVAFTGHTADIEKICYSHDHTKLLSCSADNTIKEWSVEYKECTQTYSLHYDTVLWIEYNSSSNKFLSSSRDFAIREWNSKTNECEVELIGLSYFMRSTQFDYNAGKVLSALSDGSIREWDVKTGKCINTYLGHKARVYSAIYDSTCTRILSSSLDKSVYEWEVDNENMFVECGKHDDCVDSATYIDDDNAMSIDSDGDIAVYKRKNGRLNKTSAFKIVMGNGILPNKTVGVNTLYYLPSSDKLYITSWDKSIYRTSLTSKTVDHILKHHNDWIYCCAFTKDKKTMYSSSKDGTICVWSINQESAPRFLKSFDLSMGSIYTIELDESEESLLCSTANSDILIVNADSGEEILRLKGHKSRVFSARYSRDYRYVVSYSEDQQIIIWDLVHREILNVIPCIMGIMVNGCTFNNITTNSPQYLKDIITRYGGVGL